MRQQLFAVLRRALGGLTGHCVTQEGADWTRQLNLLSHDTYTNTDTNMNTNIDTNTNVNTNTDANIDTNI